MKNFLKFIASCLFVLPVLAVMLGCVLYVAMEDLFNRS